MSYNSMHKSKKGYQMTPSGKLMRKDKKMKKRMTQREAILRRG